MNNSSAQSRNSSKSGIDDSAQSDRWETTVRQRWDVARAKEGKRNGRGGHRRRTSGRDCQGVFPVNEESDSAHFCFSAWPHFSILPH